MKKKLCVLPVCLVVLFAVAGCSLQRSPVINSVDLSKYDYSNAASLKESDACATYIFGFLGPIGDPSVIKAIRDGGIKTVKV